MLVTRMMPLWRYWKVMLFLFWLGTSLPAQAQQASKPLVPKYFNRVLAPLPSSKEAYLVVTAAGASTDILVIAGPSVPPPTLAQALRSAVAETPLRLQPVEWSFPTDRIPWAAAHCSLRRGHVGAWRADNTVPISALRDGLQDAGFQPRLLLHLPVTSICGGLPAPFADFNGDCWYNLREMRPQDSLQVSSAITPAGLLPLLLPFLLIPSVGLAAQAAAALWARLRDPERRHRKHFESISYFPTFIGWVGWMIGSMFSINDLNQLHAINDVWFGREGNGDLFSAWFSLVLVAVTLTFWNGRRLAIRLYGPEGRRGQRLPRP